jgi:hypothetical protein
MRENTKYFFSLVGFPFSQLHLKKEADLAHEASCFVDLDERRKSKISATNIVLFFIVSSMDICET